MSEKILKALMQLFAIIARPESNRSDRRTVVEAFLRRQLNKELVNEYLKVFDSFYHSNQNKIAREETEDYKRAKNLSSVSVRVLKIGTEINEELELVQKIIVLVQLLEFVKSDSTEVSQQEEEFILTIADIFHIQTMEYERIRNFVLFSFDKLPNSSRILVIDNKKPEKATRTKHIHNESLHGQIRVLNVASAQMYLLKYIGTGEMYLNGQLIQQEKIYVLNNGTSVRNPQIKPIYFSDIVSSFNKDKIRFKILFEAKNLSYKFKNGKIGLHPMNFSEESGRLIGIMGASGAGKSTLLNVLNGSVAPTEGEVLINNINIHGDDEKIEGLIGHVSQDDLLIEELSVFQNLYYNAKLCFSQLENEAIVDRVNRMLKSLGLLEIKDVQVGTPLNKKISGGQRKRLNIALELIREPAILFLDEPTSGLSSRDSENIMDLLKELALKGKLVFVVIHQPSSDIFKMFDRLLILDHGGYLIYNGDPIDSIVYFKSKIQHANWNASECHVCGNVNPEQVFNIVESNVLDEYGKLTHTRKISPKEWNEYYEEYSRKNGKKANVPRKLPNIALNIPNKINQFLVFVKRDILAKISDSQYMIINFLEAPLLAFILSFIIKYYNVNVTNEHGYTLSGNSNLPVYLFMSVIIAIFVGLTVSAEEIIKDRKILKREAFLNLSWSSYLVSKISVLFIISAIQALTFVLVGNSIMEIKGMYFEYWLLLFSTWASANIMGLVISDTFKTVVTIYILIPFFVIPQIILSGVIVKYEKLNPTISSPSRIPFYGEMLTARWGYEALAVYQFVNNDYDRLFYDLDKKMSHANFKKNYWVLDLKNKIDFIERNIDKEKSIPRVKSYLKVLRNEIGKETEDNTLIPFGYTDSLHYDLINKEIIDSTGKYVKMLNKFYIRLYNIANAEKDKRILKMQNEAGGKENFLQLKRQYHNEKLTEFVTNSSEMDRIVEYKSHLYQKIDPIYQNPDHLLLKAHFYAPRKNLIFTSLPTYWANIIVIWLMAIILYVLLYYRALKRLIALIEELMNKSSLRKFPSR